MIEDGDAQDDAKMCSCCYQWLSVLDFYTTKNGGPSSLCKQCTADKAIQWGKSNPDKRKIIRIRGYFRNKGIEPDDEMIETVLKAKVCDICGNSPTGKKGLNIDHCHKSNRLRGLLCNLCNLSIGMMQDSPGRLRDAAKYLERHMPQ